MSRPTRIMSMALIATLLALIAGPVAMASAAAPLAKWTVMVYMSGDNNLEPYIVKDLELELAAQGSTANVQITALADRGPGYDKSRGDWKTTKLYHPTQGMLADAASAVADWGERDMGDPPTLARLRRRGRRPTTPPATTRSTSGVTAGAGTRTGRCRTTRRAATASTPTRSSRSSRSSGSSTSSATTPATWPRSRSPLWHGHATALVGSQEFVNLDGIEYDVVIAQMNANPNMTADQVAAASSASATAEATYSSMARRRPLHDALKNAVDAWSIALKAALPAQKAAILRGFANAKVVLAGPDGPRPVRPGEADQRPGHRRQRQGQGHGGHERRRRRWSSTAASPAASTPWSTASRSRASPGRSRRTPTGPTTTPWTSPRPPAGTSSRTCWPPDRDRPSWGVS